MNTIKTIRPGIEIATGPNEVCIKILEDLLEQARSGEVSDVIFAAIDEDGGIRSGWSMTSRYPHEVIGALEFTKLEYVDYVTV